MKNTFKKALLATSIAAGAGLAQAAVVTVPGATNISFEGSVGATSVAAPDVTATLEAEYTQNDTITFTISGAEYDAANSTPAILFTDDPGLGASANAATLGLLSQTDTSVTFRITAVTDDAADGVVFNGGTFVLSGMAFKTSSVIDAAGDINVSYSALTNNAQSIDNSGTLTAVNATVVEQLSSSVTKALNGIVDVQNDRQQFTAGDDTITTDVMVVTPVEAVAAVNDVAFSVATHIIKGDFSWMDTDSDGTIDAGEEAAAFAATTGGDDVLVTTITGTDTIQVVGTDGGADAVEAYTFTFTNAGIGAGNAILSAQDFTISTTLAYDAPAAAAATKTILTDSDTAGSWTLNGSVVRVPYLVVNNSRFGLIANVTNHGAQTGDIVLDVWDEDGTVLATNYAAGTSTPGSLVSVASSLKAALTAAGKDLDNTTKFSFQITTNVPEEDIFVYAAYTDATTAERAIVNTDAAVQTK